LVNTQGMIDSWTTYMGDDIARPGTTKIGSTLQKLSEGTRKLGDESRIVFHRVRQDLILGWAEEHQVGDPESIRERLQASITSPAAVP